MTKFYRSRDDLREQLKYRDTTKDTGIGTSEKQNKKRGRDNQGPFRSFKRKLLNIQLTGVQFDNRNLRRVKNGNLTKDLQPILLSFNNDKNTRHGN